jgi:hypothetical protein
LPHPQPCLRVDRMLKKNRHGIAVSEYFARDKRS